MIIVKTNNGTKFINEKEAVIVCHDKKAKQVSFLNRETMQGVTISDVESVTYTTDAQPIEWKDEGLEIERLKAELENEKCKISEMYKHLGYVRDWLLIYHGAFERIKYDCERAKRENNGIYVNPCAIIDEAEKKYAESLKHFEKVFGQKK